MTRLLSLEDLDLATLRGVPVLVRVDFNVPLKEGRVTDDTRLVEALPTLRELTAAGARLLLCSHCGRPKGERNPKYSLRPAADRLAELLGRPVAFADDCIGEPAAAAAAALGSELTVPGVGQSVLITRVSTLSTDMPAGETLPELAAAGVTR